MQLTCPYKEDLLSSFDLTKKKTNDHLLSLSSIVTVATAEAGSIVLWEFEVSARRNSSAVSTNWSSMSWILKLKGEVPISKFMFETWT